MPTESLPWSAYEKKLVEPLPKRLRGQKAMTFKEAPYVFFCLQFL